jgi:hypothetical protein
MSPGIWYVVGNGASDAIGNFNMLRWVVWKWSLGVPASDLDVGEVGDKDGDGSRRGECKDLRWKKSGLCSLLGGDVRPSRETGSSIGLDNSACGVDSGDSGIGGDANAGASCVARDGIVRAGGRDSRERCPSK